MEYVRTTVESSQLGKIALPANLVGRMVDVIILPAAVATIDEMLEEAIWKSKPKRIDVDFDENGAILIDKDKHPELYDWAVKG